MEKTAIFSIEEIRVVIKFLWLQKRNQRRLLMKLMEHMAADQFQVQLYISGLSCLKKELLTAETEDEVEGQR